MRSTFLLLSTAVMLAAGCAKEAAEAPKAETKAKTVAAAAPVDRDEHSYAEPGKVIIKDLALELVVDFDAKTLGGSATYDLQWKDPKATELVLDTRDLSIGKVEGEDKGAWQPLTFALAEKDPILGSKLTIQTPSRPTKVRVSYTTSPEASGLQWLTPEMTEGKKLPFMFSQSQQIHARSWVPLQDTPQVRFTYTAHVTSRPDVMVLMSADNDPNAVRDGDYNFKMPQAIPSYLLAIAAGDLVFKPISERSGVWAEPAMVDKAAKEFEDTEKMIATTENLYGPYRWGRYDMLVLPPSFPYGGMENPRLSFITPTVIVGDKSLVSLIAHELAHSWSGNLVTFSSAKHGWLNEGFTSYVENRIVEALYGQETSNMEFAIARDGLKKQIGTMDPAVQALAVKPGTVLDADDALSAVAYDKGAWFLQFLEQRFGRQDFDAFLRGYFDHFAFQSITTETFLDYAKKNLFDKYPGRVTDAEIQNWVYGPSIPADAPKAQSRGFAVVDTARIAWQGSGTLPVNQLTREWSTQQWIRFLEGMGDTLPLDKLQQLDKAYHFTGTPNGEIAMRWYPLAIRSGDKAAWPAAGEFIQHVGRRKLIMPIYGELVKSPDGLAFAKRVFEKAKPGYHPITTGSVQDVIAKAEAGK